MIGMPLEMLESTQQGSETVLSARELEIVLLAARGLSNQHIANCINVAEATVKRHMANINVKMGTHSRGEAARKAIDEGLIATEEITEDDVQAPDRR